MRITTSGESHGRGLFAIIEGLPHGLVLDMGAIDAALALRQKGFGRGARQDIEYDKVEILSGVFQGQTTGSPVCLAIWNKDEKELPPLTAVRPGHADLAGALKFNTLDARQIFERASARETAIRVAAGEICRQCLAALGIHISGYVVSIGRVKDEGTYPFETLSSRDGETGMLDSERSLLAKAEIANCREEGDTLGGVCEVRVKGIRSGFGSCMTHAEKLDARLGSAVLSIQAAKGVELGAGFAGCAMRGSDFHDEIFYEEGRGYYRKTNRAGGIEGGMSNGEEIVLRAAMKPLPTLRRGLQTVDICTKHPTLAAAERGDTCAVFAFERVVESVVASELCAAVLERLGGESVDLLKKRYGELPQ